MQKLSQSLLDAQIIGNKEEADKIKAQIDERFKGALPKPKENIVRFNTILNDDRAPAKKVYIFLNSELGTNWWEWEMETVDRLLWMKFGIAIEDINRDKIFAIRHLCRSDLAFNDWWEFNQLALSFSGSIADFDMIRKPSIGMVINAVKTMNMIRPERQWVFGKDVISYICILLKEDGIYAPPPSLVNLIEEKFVTMISTELQQKWPLIKARYMELVEEKNTDIKEDVVDIQARRIFSAEAASVSYGA